MLRKALDKNIISENDFYKDDEYIMNKIYEENDNEVMSYINKLKTGDFEIQRLPKKIRHVNPLYLEDNNLKEIIAEDLEYKKLVDNYLEKRQKYIDEK